MHLGQRLEVMQNLDLVCEQSLLLVGGATESIFPRSEAMLLANSDVQHALQFFGTKQDMETYRSMMDYVFCQTTGRYKSQCRAFYRDEAPPLREILSKQQIAWYEQWIPAAIAVAYFLYDKKRRWLGWKKVRRLVVVQAKVEIREARIHVNFGTH